MTEISKLRFKRAVALMAAAAILALSAATAACTESGAKPSESAGQNSSGPESSVLTESSQTSEGSQSSAYSEKTRVGLSTPAVYSVEFDESDPYLVCVTDGTPAATYTNQIKFAPDLSIVSVRTTEEDGEYDVTANIESTVDENGRIKTAVIGTTKAAYFYGEEGRLEKIAAEFGGSEETVFEFKYDGNVFGVTSEKFDGAYYGLTDYPFTVMSGDKDFETSDEISGEKGFGVGASLYEFIPMTEREYKMYCNYMLLRMPGELKEHFERGYFWDGQI